MAGNYAKGTTVNPSGSRAEIERTLTRFGVQTFAYGAESGRAVLFFEKDGRRIRYSVSMPDFNEKRFHVTPARQIRRTPASARAEWEQACAERWRALAAGIKAKLAMIEAGITTFEEEFLAHTMLPNGQTVFESTAPALAAATEGKPLPALLPGLGN